MENHKPSSGSLHAYRYYWGQNQQSWWSYPWWATNSPVSNLYALYCFYANTQHRLKSNERICKPLLPWLCDWPQCNQIAHRLVHIPWWDTTAWESRWSHTAGWCLDVLSFSKCESHEPLFQRRSRPGSCLSPGFWQRPFRRLDCAFLALLCQKYLCQWFCLKLKRMRTMNIQIGLTQDIFTQVVAHTRDRFVQLILYLIIKHSVNFINQNLHLLLSSDIEFFLSWLGLTFDCSAMFFFGNN